MITQLFWFCNKFPVITETTFKEKGCDPVILCKENALLRFYDISFRPL